LGKIANDLRLLSSGPQAGLGELELPKVQAGSSIMPGKVNPVIPEVVNQIVFQVVGYTTTITMAAEAGQLELNAFEPIMFKDLFAAAELLSKGITTLIDNCLSHLKVNQDHCQVFSGKFSRNCDCACSQNWLCCCNRLSKKCSEAKSKNSHSA
jgi:aspartate ammonia-lyase